MRASWQFQTVLEAAIAKSNVNAALKDGETRHVLVEKDFTRKTNDQ